MMLPAIKSKTRLIRENMHSENFCLARQYSEYTSDPRSDTRTLGYACIDSWMR